MTTSAKIISGVVASTGVIGGSIGTAYALRSPSNISISKQLENEGKKILISSASSDLWNIKLKTYQKQKATLTIIELAEENIGTLKSKCNSNLTSEFNEKNKPLYEALKTVCTSPTNKEKLFSLDHEIAEDWSTKASTYNSVAQTEHAIEEFKNTRPTGDQIREWCEKIIKEEFKSDTDKNYKLSIKWCTKKGV
ncbi:hypothetical protein A6V39_03665 [Candidatus Mycoplasma haematobovis]|uniref:Uncharacterized protein n=1 Tax=Candidatus Mycoplasma haematobovis TaxID=432608 RepID=A0A1A9QD13_9MOLU|nr:hypothetical protein [Candidatus Mycoplasma haematobovis]OAL09984.1 hypothetical protein A6V39_03665 [Candidatus Mycoplasma haematobovis]